MTNKATFILLLCLLPALSVVHSADIPLPVVPYPQKVERRSGTFSLVQNQLGFDLAVSDSTILSVAIRELQSVLLPTFGLSFDRGQLRERNIQVGIPAHDERFDALCRRRSILPGEKLGREGYILDIDKQEIVIAANDYPGLFYGLQTLKQLIGALSEGDGLACLKITDWPVLRYRGMQDDISRGPVPTLDFMKDQIRRCAEMKLNMLSYYIEHVVATESEPYFAPAGGAISSNEWRELSDFAKDYFVELVGSFQSFGHFEKVLSNPLYEPLGESGRLLSPAFEESYELLESVYSEMAPAFSSHFFNINCDETFDLGRGASKKMVDSLGIAEVYLRHVLRLSGIVRGLGKQVMMWGDVLLSHPELFERIPDETVIMTWDYSAYDAFDFLVDPIKNAGFDFFVVPGVLNSNRMMPDYVMTKTNIRNFARTGVEQGALGLLNTVWDDGGFALFSRDWLGVAYAAEKSWNSQPQHDDSFDGRFDMAVYGDNRNKISQAILKLTELSDLGVTQEMNEEVFWQKVIPDRGEAIKIDAGGWPEVLGICDKASRTLSEARADRHGEELAVWEFTIAQYRHLAELRRNLLAASGAYKEAVLSQRSDPEMVRPGVLRALDLIADLEASARFLLNDYRALWLMENKTYWLDRNLARYEERVGKLQEIQSLLFEAIDDLDKGHVLPPPEAVRLAIDEANGQYFQYWLALGPFPNRDRKSYDIDFLAPAGGEAAAIGKVAEQFHWEDGKTYRWKKVSFPTYAECNLADVYEDNKLVLAYAYASIESDRAQNVRASFGSNDGIKVILNGKRLFERHVTRNLMPDEEETILPLVEGKNHLLLKIDQGKGDWGFSFRLPDNVVRNHKHKYRIIQ